MVKTLIVGDGECGKTCLLMSYSKKEFPEYVPSSLELEARTIEVDGKTVQLVLWDTCRQLEDYDRIRALSYAGTDVILMCFSIDSPDSLGNTSVKKVPESPQCNADSAFFLTCSLRKYT